MYELEPNLTAILAIIAVLVIVLTVVASNCGVCAFW